MANKPKRTTAIKPREGMDVLNDIRRVAQTAIKAVQDGNASMGAIALKALELEGRHYGIFDHETIVSNGEIEPREIVFNILPATEPPRTTIGKKKVSTINE